MPGRPVLRAFAATLALNSADPETDPDGLEPVLDRVVSGMSVRAIAADLGTSAGTLMAWLNQGGKDGPRWRAYQESRRLRAFVKSDEAQEVLAALPDDASLTSARVSLAGAKVAHLRWQAERDNREDFGTQTAAPITLNIQELHLDALKAAGGPVAVLASREPAQGVLDDPARSGGVEEADYEVVEDLSDKAPPTSDTEAPAVPTGIEDLL